LTGVFEEEDEELHGLTLQTDGEAVPAQFPGGGVQDESSEADRKSAGQGTR
jgi:hypothetical protein